MALKFLGTVPAGFPSPASDYMDDEIDFGQLFRMNSPSVFVMRVSGDSMIEAHIPKGAIAVIDKSITPRNNAVVVAILNGEYTLKYLVHNQFGCKLIAANKKIKDIDITEDMDFRVWGVVTHIVIDFKKMVI
jgi:DNA polymerase V